ncbi:MAG: glycyl-radical enzyme activating protein [Bacteroidetes bacterium]|nr:glycyl-radical enzyme activating protein [Bacteroidota bacterium]
MQSKGNIFNIQHFSVHDGPGIRTTVFFKGCPLACWWCHNPEGRGSEIEVMNGKTIGRTVDADELLEEILKDRIFYDESGGGVTFSGGEPLAQPAFLKEMLVRCRKHGIHTAIDTSGYVSKASLRQVLPFTDLFLFDLKIMDPVKHLRYTDVSNVEIIDNLQYLLSKKARVIVRVPVIPEITFTAENLNQIATYLKQFDPVPEVNLLPFHRIGEGKYNRYNIRYKLNHKKEPKQEDLVLQISAFEKAGIPAKIGG